VGVLNMLAGQALYLLPVVRKGEKILEILR
jgi:hypothetical protein